MYRSADGFSGTVVKLGFYLRALEEKIAYVEKYHNNQLDLLNRNVESANQMYCEAAEQVAQVHSELETTKTALRNMQEKLTAKNLELEKMQIQFKEMESDYETMRSKLFESEHQCAQLADENAAAHSKFAAMQSELSK